jgi:class 3 adenylate cyclase
MQSTMARHDTQHELYAIKDRVWTLIERFKAFDEAAARERGQAWHAVNNAPSVVVEERRDGADTRARIVWRSPGTFAGATPPELHVDLGSRLFMVAACGVALGAIGAVISSVVLAAARGSVNGFLVVLAFLAFAVGGGLLVFRTAVPMALILWRNKPEDARRKIIAVLGAGGGDMDDEADAPAVSAHARTMSDGYRRPETGGAVTDTPASPSTPASAGAAILQGFITAETEKLKQFADHTLTALTPNYPELQSFQRYGFNLFVAGALKELSQRDGLTPTTARAVLTDVLVSTGTEKDAATAFQERLDTAADRPRFARMIDAGRAAMAAHMDQTPLADDGTPTAMMQFWSKSGGADAGTRTLSLLLTDLVGSTAMTGKLGNAGAQRVVRAHNAIVRAAVKLARGTEVKHTGDGILASFDTAVQAAQAATEIQQEIAALVKANPDMPLSVRIGLHDGDVAIDGIDVFGDAVCAAGGAGDITVSAAIQHKSAGGTFKYTQLADASVAVNGTAQAIYRLSWEPKRAYGVPPIEYRQIGTKPT